jgi:hypothetical protein
MTDHDHTDAGDRHLDDEALSAVLDGEATPTETAHADGCAPCTARLGELRDASLLVRTPVPVAGDDARDAAVASALAAADVATVTPLRRRAIPAWLAAAAALVVIAVGVVAFAGRGDDGQTTASGKAGDDDAALDTTTALATPFAEATVAPVDGGDLGEVEGTDLRAAIDGSLAAPAARDSVGGTAASGAAGASPDASACEQTARDGNPALDALVYRATGTFQGDPVAVLAFDVSADDGSVDRWVYVVTVDGCAIRNETTYSV